MKLGAILIAAAAAKKGQDPVVPPESKTCPDCMVSTTADKQQVTVVKGFR